MVLEVSGASKGILAGLACSPSCNVFFSGELYSRTELCSDLRLPADCRDAELVLSAWSAWGPDAFERLDGVFSIVVQVMGQERLWAARDPMGHRPLFFAKVDRGMVFSESVALLLQHPNVSGEINRLNLARRSFGYLGEPHETFYNSVHRVPPAHQLCATKDRWTLKQYWFLPEVRPAEEYSLDEARQHFLRDFERVVARQHESGPPSILLSGGLDSISVAKQSAEICRSRGMACPLALSMFFPDPDCNEQPIQEAVARMLGLQQLSMSLDEAAGSRGLIQASLALSPKLSAPLGNTWRPAYLTLLNAAKGFGNGLVLTGVGGDEWLGVSPLYNADLIRRGQVLSVIRTVREQLRSFDVPLHSALRYQLWTCGLRPLVIRGIRPIITKFAAPVARALWRRRQHIPTWVAPDVDLRAELTRCLERDVERQFETVLTRGRYALYNSDASYSHPLVSSDREEDFEISKMIGQRLQHPYWDARLVSRLAEIPPEWLAYDGYSKGLVRGPVAEALPGLGLERKKKVTSTKFSIKFMRRELPSAWDTLGGPKKLYDLGVIDRRRLEAEKPDMLSSGNANQLYRLWLFLNMESWVRAKI